MAKRKRLEVKQVWVAEVCYKYSRWLTLWTTCRLRRKECVKALNDHSSGGLKGEYFRRRIVKFKR